MKFDVSTKPFTYQYSQPSEYRFSMDSVEMAFRLGMEFQQRNLFRPLRVLDLCSGCGVLGFEFHFFERRIEFIDFVEVQQQYVPHFDHNRSLVQPPLAAFHFHLKNYQDLLCDEFESRYDVVLCNPPFFRAGHGTLAPSEFKNRCRFFLDSSFEVLAKTIQHVLAPQGEGYVIFRSLHEHGFDAVKELKTLLAQRCVVDELEPVRTARFVRVTIVNANL